VPSGTTENVKLIEEFERNFKRQSMAGELTVLPFHGAPQCVASLELHPSLDRRLRMLRLLDHRCVPDLKNAVRDVRDAAVTHIFHVARDLSLGDDTLFSAIRISDMALATLPPHDAELRGAASLLIAMKMCEPKPHGASITVRPGDAQEELIQEELLIFGAIGYNVYMATPFGFASCLVGADDGVRRVLREVCIAAAKRFECTKYLCEQVAVACVAIAKQIAANGGDIDAVAPQDQCAREVLAGLKESDFSQSAKSK
jgi:hypothetical protein